MDIRRFRIRCTLCVDHGPSPLLPFSIHRLQFASRPFSAVRTDEGIAAQRPLDPQWFPVVRLSFQSLQFVQHDEAVNRVEGLE